MKPKAARKPRTSRATTRSKPSLKLLQQIVQALDAKKADDLRVLEVSRQSSITDYLVVATGTSEPHLRALRIELERVLDEAKVNVVGVDTTKGSGWTVVDTFEIMVHLLTRENRDRYKLEALWRDATEIPVAKLLG
ncbi:MAG TPA: ribosome silencing factor [Lacunisphaera sp.]|jgi:ribosome-associated protein|nr:ribosome silencing factor [Lacunisphaera sp.]